MPLKNNDLIIMSSDGTGNDFEQIVNDNVHLYCDQHPQEIATFLMDQVLEKNNLDDISIIVIKVVIINLVDFISLNESAICTHNFGHVYL